jgi:hypothetical protein
MADVFISYAKADRPLALKLAAMLEAEGWKVWWDTSLIPGDDFRNEIMTELGRARAVIVIWTDASIKSDWVRSEAGRAQADRKLIPVKLPNLSYKDLPPPFDVLHTENIGEEDKIKAAVVAQLAKPAVEPTAVALLAKGFKYELLTWFGIVGGALTLFGNMDAVLKLADWARVLVQHWKEWTHSFWVWVFGWLGIHLPPEWTPVLSFLLFWSLLAIGQAFQFKQSLKNQSSADIGESYLGVSFPTYFMQWLPMFALVVCVLIAAAWLGRGSLHGFYPTDFAADFIAKNLPSSMAEKALPYLEHGLLPVLIMLAFLIPNAVNQKLQATVATCLMVIFWTIITLNQLIAMPPSEGFANFTAIAMISNRSQRTLKAWP